MYGKFREKQGVDTQIFTRKKNYKVQEKFRKPEYYWCRKNDLYIELKNEARGGDGWFIKYKGNIDFIGYYFIKDYELSEIYFILYNSDFFDTVQKQIDNNNGRFTGKHYQEFKDGSIGGATSGFIVSQIDIQSAEVARFYFNKNKFYKEKSNHKQEFTFDSPT